MQVSGWRAARDGGISDAKEQSPHAIAGLMKGWLRMLPGGLLQLSEEELALAYAAKDPIVTTRKTLSDLRGTVRGETFRWLVGLLAEVERASPRTQMPSRELAITLAPVLIGDASGDREHTLPHVMRFLQHCIAVMSRRQRTLVQVSPTQPNIEPQPTQQPTQQQQQPTAVSNGAVETRGVSLLCRLDAAAEGPSLPEANAHATHSEAEEARLARTAALRSYSPENPSTKTQSRYQPPGLDATPMAGTPMGGLPMGASATPGGLSWALGEREGGRDSRRWQEPEPESS